MTTAEYIAISREETGYEVMQQAAMEGWEGDRIRSWGNIAWIQDGLEIFTGLNEMIQPENNIKLF